MFFYLAFFWFIRTTKFVLFYLYLWQLKEYHLGRFLDHFRTEKGRRLLWNPMDLLKIIFLIYFFAFPFFFPSSLYLFSIYSLLPSAILILYFAESIKAIRDIFQKKLKLPTLTKKTVLLALSLFLSEVLFLFILFNFERDLNFFAFWLLTADVFTPFLTSVIILTFQPLTVLIKNLAIQRAKKKINNAKNLFVIGITGSYGKSSTKEFLYTILSEKFKVLKTKANQNSEAGISQCILNDLKPEHEIFIVEMGAYGRRGIRLLCDIVKPKFGILTGINEQHLSLFGSQENIIKTKYELIESLPENGLAVFNGDNQYCLELYSKTDKPKKIFSAQHSTLKFQLNLWAENIIVKKDFVFFKVYDREGNTNFRAYVSGAHFIPNLLGAILVAKELGMSFQEISQACLKIKPMQKTMEILKGKNELTIIDDSYSANPASVLSALEYLKIYLTKKIIVLPCLIELGKTSKEVHRKIGEEIGKVCDAVIITTKERFEEIKEGALKTGLEKESILFSEDPEQISEIIEKFFGPGDIVLLEGRIPDKLISLLVD